MPSYADIIQQASEFLRQGKTHDATVLFEQLLQAVPGDPIALEFLGVQANKAGDHKKAVKLLTEAASHTRRRESALFQLGHAHRDGGDLTAAASAYERYVAVKEDPGGAISLADVYLSLGKTADAEHALSKALDLQPDNVKALALLAQTQDLLERITDAKSTRHRALRVSTQDEDALMIQASLWLDLDEREKAFAAISGFTNSVYGDALKEIFLAYDHNAAEHSLPAVQGTAPLDGDSPLIIGVGDPVYMARYAADLAHSVTTHSPDTDLHLHMISPEQVTNVPTFSEDTADATVSWEHESDATKVTYASRRFIRSALWRRTLSRPLVIIDLDSQVRGPVGAVLDQLPPFDVAMYHRKNEIFLKQRIAAGFLALAPTPGAQIFIDQVAAYILHFERNGTALWFVDQLALLATRCMTEHEVQDPSVRITDVPMSFLDWGHMSPDSLIWTTKGVHKTLPPLA